MSQSESHHDQIEDIIDARNESGQYDALCSGVRQQSFNQGNQGNVRYAYSTPGSSIMADIRDNICIHQNSEKNADFDFGPTDSEITLCRVKRENNNVKKCKVNNWDVMHDSAIPGDGTHLGESPSLVNLVTLVMPNGTGQKSQGESLEYLVPLSSWEPAPASDSNNTDTPSTERTENTQFKFHIAPSTLNVQPKTDEIFSINLSNVSENSLACCKSVEKQRSVKDLFKRMAFWKRKSRESVNISNK